MFQNMRQGTILTYRDRSVNYNASTYGVRASTKNSKHWILDHGRVTETGNLLISLQDEHIGTIAILITLYMICHRWGLSSDIPPVTVLLEKKEVINRIQDEISHLIIKKKSSIIWLMGLSHTPYTNALIHNPMVMCKIQPWYHRNWLYNSMWSLN